MGKRKLEGRGLGRQCWVCVVYAMLACSLSLALDKDLCITLWYLFFFLPKQETSCWTTQLGCYLFWSSCKRFERCGTQISLGFLFPFNLRDRCRQTVIPMQSPLMCFEPYNYTPYSSRKSSAGSQGGSVEPCIDAGLPSLWGIPDFTLLFCGLGIKALEVLILKMNTFF